MSAISEFLPRRKQNFAQGGPNLRAIGMGRNRREIKHSLLIRIQHLEEELDDELSKLNPKKVRSNSTRITELIDEAIESLVVLSSKLSDDSSLWINPNVIVETETDEWGFNKSTRIIDNRIVFKDESLSHLLLKIAELLVWKKRQILAPLHEELQEMLSSIEESSTKNKGQYRWYSEHQEQFLRVLDLLQVDNKESHVEFCCDVLRLWNIIRNRKSPNNP